MGMATNSDIGARIGITGSGVSRIRTGGRVPNLDTMRRIEDATGWTIEAQSRAAADGGREGYAVEFNQRVCVDAPEPVKT